MRILNTLKSLVIDRLLKIKVVIDSLLRTMNLIMVPQKVQVSSSRSIAVFYDKTYNKLFTVPVASGRKFEEHVNNNSSNLEFMGYL